MDKGGENAMIMRWAAGLALALVLGMGAAAGVAAQDRATPEASPVAVAEDLTLPVSLVPWVVTDMMIPAAEQCTVEALSTDAVADSLIEIEPRDDAALTDNLLVTIEAQGPADQATIDGVLATLTQFWACNNAGNRAAMVAVFTPQGISDLYGIDLSLAEADLRAAVATALTESEPRPAEETSGIDGIISIVALEDGRTAALVLNTDPRIAGGDQVLDLIIFVDENGQYMIDSFIGDPFDQTPGYGVEK
jgi:hypothetical protein